MKDPNNTRDTVPRPGSPLWIYLLCVTVAGIAVLACALGWLAVPDLKGIAGDPVFWLLGSFIVFGELRPIITPGAAENNGATTSTSFSFAALLYAGLPVAVRLQAAAVLVCGLLRRRPPHRIPFNIAPFALSLAAPTL